ncbi:hypothetical protein K503DRAFT_172259 [Rhizopogon vinicolor AM-OR11-026]|uniref:Uncharacterized protein n=1 Tax=Rhizopogon vinicolor AM-OR11-026 TaxID=1314800 RepID=A0A1B7N0A8_9AGAM|nr:hypothetical protein K503DRAFT_172259 [Rhizopogon vinicolor AM-OR11-026]
MTPGKRVAEPPQNSYQPRDTSQLSRQATTGKMRKGKQSKKAMADREEHQREEIRFNLAYSFRDTRSGASARRRQAGGREDGDASDYPPPPAYEVATSPALSSLASSALASSTFVARVHMHSEHPSFENRTSSSGSTQPAATHGNVIPHADAVTSALQATPGTTPTLSPLTIPVPMPSPRPTGSCTFPMPVQQRALLDDDESSSVEFVDIDPPQRWEMDRQRGVPLQERATRHHQLIVEPHVSAGSQRSRLFSQAPKRSPTSQARFANSRLSLRIPEDQDPYSDDRTQAESIISSPITPKHKLPIQSFPLSPSRIFHRSQSPQPSSSVISLLRNPSPFFKSTPSLLNLSSPSTIHSGHGDHPLSRKLFQRKQKGREQLEDWEVLDRTESSHSSLEESPVRTRTPSLAPASSSAFVETWPYPNVFTEETQVSTANRHPYRPSAQTTPPAEERPQRPASPPFVNRHVRRRTSSSMRSDHTCPSSAPVSPISSYSASLFSSSSLSLATVGRTLPSFSQQDLAICEEPERSRSPTRGIALRDSPSLSTLSLSQPSVGKALTSFSQMDLANHQAQHEHVRSHSTPRAVTPLELPKTPRTQARVSPVSASEVTYVDYNVTPPTPTSPAPNNNCLPTRSATERVSRRRTTARREEILVHRGRSLSRDLEMRSAPAYSMIFPSGPPTPPPESHTPPFKSHTPPPESHTPPLEEDEEDEESHTPPYSPTPTTPRRHYAGRPLPQTPLASPSLTWLVGRTPGPPTSAPSTVLYHPRAIPQSPHVPEGLLIDLDDDSLDEGSTSIGSHTPPIHSRTPPLPNRTPPLPDNTPMIPDRTPPARTPTPLPIDYLEDDIDSDSLTVGSSSPRGPLTPTSTISASSSCFSFSPSMRTITPPPPEFITDVVGSLEDDQAQDDDGSDYHDDVSIRDAQFTGPYLKSPTCAGASPHLRFHRACHITWQS